MVTADALPTQRERAEYLLDREAHDVVTPEGNQKKLHSRLKSLPWKGIALHGRIKDSADHRQDRLRGHQPDLREAGFAQLAKLIEDHCQAETLCHVRDTTFAEDARQRRTGNSPRAMDTWLNLAIARRPVCDRARPRSARGRRGSRASGATSCRGNVMTPRHSAGVGKGSEQTRIQVGVAMRRPSRVPLTETSS